MEEQKKYTWTGKDGKTYEEVKIGSLWGKMTKVGQVYTGKVNNEYVTLKPNRNKKGEASPDFFLVKSVVVDESISHSQLLDSFRSVKDTDDIPF